MFEFLFKYPVAAYRKGEIMLASGWPIWLLLLLSLLVIGGLRFYLHRTSHRLQGGTVWGIWILQSLAAILVLVLLWQPALAVQSLKNRQNAIALLVDTSRSMSLQVDGQSRLEQVTNAFSGEVMDSLEERFRVQLYGFSGFPQRLASLQLENIPEPGKSSGIGESLLSVLQESTAVPLGAVLIASDGADNTGRFGRGLMAEIGKYNIPVHTVGVGRERIEGDIELSDVSVAAKSLPHSRISAQLTLRHDGNNEKTTRITVRDDETMLASKPVTLRAGEPVKREWVDFAAGDSGVRNLSFTVEPLAAEEITGNNKQLRVMDIPRRRSRILYVEGEPRWQFKFMRRAVHADASVQLVTMLRTSTNKYYRQNVDTPEQLQHGFPDDDEELFEYDALIIGSLEAAFFTPKQQVAIRDFVSRRGGTLMMLAGRNGLGAGGWNNSEIVDVLPALLERGESTFIREKVKSVLTVQGRSSLITRLDPDPETNELLWAEMPELADYQRVGALKPGAVQLMSVQVGRDQVPLLVQQNYGRGRAVIFATGGTWRWKMLLPSTDIKHHTFWRQLLRSLVADTSGTVRLSSDRSNYSDEARVVLRAEVRTKDYEHASNALVNAVITPENGSPRTIELTPSAVEMGVYEAEVDAPELGIYRIESTAHLGDERLGADTLHVRREGDVAEYFHPEQNRSLLTRLAKNTGGRYWELDELSDLHNEIRFSQAGITAREVLDLWDMPALFLLLLALRTSEWLLRRKRGVI